MLACVPSPSALKRMIATWELRSSEVNMMVVPVRIPRIHKFTNIENLLPDTNVKFYPLAPQVWASLNTRS